MRNTIDVIGVSASVSTAQPEIVFIIAGTLAETGGPDLQMLQEVRGNLDEVETVNFIPVFWERPFPFPMTKKIPLLPPNPAKFWQHRREPPTLVTTFMPGNLPETSPAKVYVIHQICFAKPQSNRRGTLVLLVISPLASRHVVKLSDRDTLVFHRPNVRGSTVQHVVQDNRAKDFGAETAGLACVPGQTGQTPRRIKTEPIRRRTQRTFPKSRDSITISSLRFQKRPFSAKDNPTRMQRTRFHWRRHTISATDIQQTAAETSAAVTWGARREQMPSQVFKF